MMKKLPEPLGPDQKLMGDLKKLQELSGSVSFKNKPTVTKTFYIENQDDIQYDIQEFCINNPRAEIINVVPIAYHPGTYRTQLTRALIIYKEVQP